MKTRTTTVEVDSISIDGQAWNGEPLQLVICEYENAEVSKRIRIKLRPVDVEELATKLWEAREKYSKAVADMTAALKNPEATT